MYVSLGLFFEYAIRIFTILQMEYYKFMREFGWPVYYKFFLGQPYPYPITIVEPRSFYYIKDGNVDVNTDGSHDFIVCEDNNNNAIIRSVDFNKNNEEFTLDKSDISFVSMELHIGEESMEIELSNKVYNYYIVGNILDKTFFKYFIKTRYSNEYKETFNDDDFSLLDENKYIIHIIDHNVGIVQFDTNKTLHIQQTGYKLIENNINK